MTLASRCVCLLLSTPRLLAARRAGIDFETRAFSATVARWESKRAACYLVPQIISPRRVLLVPMFDPVQRRHRRGLCTKKPGDASFPVLLPLCILLHHRHRTTPSATGSVDKPEEKVALPGEMFCSRIIISTSSASRRPRRTPLGPQDSTGVASP